MLRKAWTVAIETLSWIEMRRLNERAALMRTVKQLGVKDPDAIRFAYGLVIETERRRNLIDKFINNVVAPKKIGEYNLGIQAFLRLYVYQTRVRITSYNVCYTKLLRLQCLFALSRNPLGSLL